METAEAIRLHDDLLAAMPEGARHDADICPFCTDKARAEDPQRSGALPSTDGPDVSDQNDQNTKGGTPDPMSDQISQETHEALLQKAVSDALAEQAKALETVTAERDELSSKNEELAGKVTELTADNARLNGELDTAQVSLKAAQDEVAALKTSIEEEKAAAAKSELAHKRTEQVKTLGLFSDDYVTEKASVWADLAEEAWTEKLAEWQLIKPATETASATATETASALSGTTGTLTEAPVETASEKPEARRAVLGLH